MRAALAERQRALVDGVLGRKEAVDAGLQGMDGVELERGLRTYRSNAQALADKSLSAVFVRIREVLGEPSFAAMAWSFWRRYPPQCGDLGLWGAVLADFLAEQEGMEPWLCDLARLEWAAHITERAADSALDAQSLALLSALEPAHLGMQMRPGLQLLRLRPQAWWQWLGQQPDAGGSEDELVAIVVARRVWRAEAHRLGPGAWALMSVLQAGAHLEQALQQAFAAEAGFDFSAWLQAALLNGWLRAAVSHQAS
ncbi:MAG: putative DNA-binding domain-containing protein [Paucibacter sp.]|nr:putative DNA-binding domain-containing protein [Roseateles sp.]